MEAEEAERVSRRTSPVVGRLERAPDGSGSPSLLRPVGLIAPRVFALGWGAAYDMVAHATITALRGHLFGLVEYA